MSAARTLLSLFVLAVITTAVFVVARHVVSRRHRLQAATLVQSQLTDAITRETQFRGLMIVPTARGSGWRMAPITIEVRGEVPTPELREAVMRLVRAEAWKLGPDLITVDQLFVNPSLHRAS